MTDNPLLSVPDTKNHVPEFDKIETDHFFPAIKEAIALARTRIDGIKGNDERPDFENTIEALEHCAEELDQASSVFYNQLSAVGGEELHELAQEIGPLMADFSSDIYLDKDLYERVHAVYAARDSLPLTTEQHTLLEETHKSFVRSGAALDEKKKQRLREIAQEQSRLSPSFMNNAKQSAEAFEMVIDNEDDLAGLPDSAIEGAKHAAKEQGYAGKWLFTLDMPSFIPFLQYARNRDLRKKIWRARTNTAFGDAFDNTENIKRILALRAERAEILGYKNHAEFVLEERMAASAETVQEFLETLKNAYKPAAEKELEELKAFAREEDGLKDMKPWDVAYYSEKLKHRRFEFSSEDLRPYFPLDQVLKGCFEHFSKLFGVRFETAEGYPTWHEDVKAFELYDHESGDFVGTLYGDFHPRKGKKDGAWKTRYRDQGLYNGKLNRPVVAIVCNFTKPLPGKPSLLTHNEVLTLFHEMGHAMHALLSNVRYRSLAGTNVKWDFVELPSQVQENWCYEKETLDHFARHYETGEAIPADLVDKLIKARNFMVGMAGLRQVSLGTLDMAYHTQNPAKINDIGAFEEAVTKDCSLFPKLGGPISTSFGHIFAGGYSAGYYSYKWAEVLDADAFEAFKENGLYDAETAKAYKEKVLARGGSDDPNILYRDFRGRDADPEALIRREGLSSSQSKAA